MWGKETTLTEEEIENLKRDAGPAGSLNEYPDTGTGGYHKRGGAERMAYHFIYNRRLPRRI